MSFLPVQFVSAAGGWASFGGLVDGIIRAAPREFNRRDRPHD
jgi:hypothetical protein